MNPVERYNKYKEDPLDQIILLIRNGTIKTGKYSGLIKIKKEDEVKGKELFKHAKNNSES